METRDTPDVSTETLDTTLRQRAVVIPGGGQGRRVQRVIGGLDEPMWLICGYEAYKCVAHDPRFSADHFHPGYPSVFPVKRQQAAVEPPLVRTYSGMDPPCHGIHRRMVADEFAYRRCETLRPWIRECVDRQLDCLFAVNDRADLVTEYAEPIASDVICGLIGLSGDSRGEWITLSRHLVGNGRDSAAVEGASTCFRQLIAQFVADKEINPDDDLTSRLIKTYKDASRYDGAQIVEFVGAIFLAGFQSTSSMITLGVLTLLDHPNSIGSIVAGDEAAISLTVDELLRFNSIADRVTARVALKDVEIEGHRIAAGDGVVASSAGANMDPLAFDCPAEFDPRRRARRHMAFGHGRHRCLGEHLARVQIEVALTALFGRYRNLALAEVHHRPRIDETCVFRRLEGPLLVTPMVDANAS